MKGIPLDLTIDREKHARIRYELSLRGLTLVEIANRAGVSISAVSAVSLGKSRSARVETILAKALDIEPDRLFPERYPSNNGGCA
ncbi:helix-turn-helix domain-containing protein [Thalassorhabdomicrobium marinisediminis]|uniref:DNA-binding protein n=1 Tax=Thalassorhabdomicrobium marinisediminis TaxID=2170577 RepID=A0A2T7FTF2_9RHOB|nr:DNA-binding protein [Thalassorhabdomicrobium marinisediminis]